VTITRQERAEQVLDALADGFNSRQIAERLGISYTYVRDLISDPTGEKMQARRDSYQGVCEMCGGPTCGSDGPAKAPRFCSTCAPSHYTPKYWTEERVLAAIRLWADIHGRPPSATEWLNGRRNDGYEPRTFPPASAVYRSSGLVSAPFEYWADAIEAAGFPRPRKGQYERTPTVPGRTERTYLVFTVNDQGDLSLLGETDAATNQEAIEVVASEAGRYAAVAKGSLMTFSLKPRLVASKE
jgi:hypothetical protein